jgi:threonyl-tRNA synthetase (EC 6.1.1.3)/Ser-tRNA(Thr) hydrolase (EC 3.1.1.-)
MRLLLIHADHIEYQARTQTPFAESGIPLQNSLEEGLVAFCAVESGDEEDPRSVAEQGAQEIAGTAEKLKVDRIMLYPYAHLSSDLASPAVAMQVLTQMAEALQDRGYMVQRAPFGWYKAFTLSCKGHPLSELAKTITPEEGVKREGNAKLRMNGSSSPPRVRSGIPLPTWTIPHSEVWSRRSSGSPYPQAGNRCMWS